MICVSSGLILGGALKHYRESPVTEVDVLNGVFEIEIRTGSELDGRLLR